MTVTSIGHGSSLTGFVVSSGNTLLVSGGGLSVSTMVQSGGLETDFGTASDTVISNGGSQTVMYGGTATGTVVDTGGTETVSVGGSTTSAYVSGGTEDVYGSAISNTILSGGEQYVFLGGVASGTFVSAGAGESISSGGTAINETVSGTVYDFGTLVGDKIGSGALIEVFAGSASSVVIQNGGLLYENGGTTISTTVDSGATLEVGATAVASATTVSAGGNLLVSSGGIISGATVLSGGEITLASGAVTNNLNLSSGAIEQIISGMVVSKAGFPSSISLVVGLGGEVLLSGAATVSNLTIGMGGTEVVESGYTLKNADMTLFTSLVVQSSGIVSAATVQSGGSITLLGGAIVSGGLSLSAGAIENIGSGFHLNNATVSGLNTQERVLSGGVVSGITVQSGSYLDIEPGATGSNIVIQSGGEIELESGAIVSGLTLNSGASEFIFGNLSAGSTISVVSSGLTLIDQFISGHTVSVYGTATQAYLYSGGGQIIESGGVATSTQIQQGGTETVLSGASTTSETINYGGSETVILGGTANASVIGGSEIVYGTALNGTVEDATSQYVQNNYSYENLVVGSQTIFKGGVANGVVVSGGNEFVYGSAIGGSVQGQTLTLYEENGEYSSTAYETGRIYIEVGGVGSGISVGSNGVVSAFGAVSSSVVGSGGSLIIENGALGTAITLDNSGGVQVFGSAISTVVSSGGNLSIYAGGAGISTTIESGGIETVFSGGHVSGGTITSGGTLVDLGGSVSGVSLNQGANVDLGDVTFQRGDSATVINGQLTLTNSAGVVLDNSVGVAGSYNGAVFAITSDTTGGTEINLAVCYLRGTRILTPTGECPIEDLKIGGRVVTRFSGVQSIKWIGRQTYASDDVRDNLDQIPVRIRAGALGERQPARDLYVSPGHSMLIDGTLVLAKLLVNGITITQGWLPHTLEYFQLELEGHDCVIAEGVWSETFADGEGLRDRFHNVAEFHRLFPDYRPPEDQVVALCAPRPQKGAALDRVLKPVIERAAAGIVPGALRGHVDRLMNPWKITGWAQDVEHLRLPVVLEVLLDGKVIGTTVACKFREDLYAGFGYGNSSFEFDSPVKFRPELLPTLQVRRASDGTTIPINKDIQLALELVPRVSMVFASGGTEAGGLEERRLH